MSDTFWKKCSTCKKEIPYSADYYQCSVSTCRHKRKGFQFCCVQCWDAHLGYANHREAWATEARAPSKAEAEQSAAPQHRIESRAPVRKVVSQSGSAVALAAASRQINTDTLVVVSKVKKLISEQSGFNTSKCCIDALTRVVVKECLKAVTKAKAAGRKTVMGRDLE